MKKNAATMPTKTKPPVKNDNFMSDVFSRFLKMLPENKEFMFRFLDLFPYVVEIFTPDGISVFVNRAGIEINKIIDISLVVGKYNLLKDPVCNDQMGMRDGIQRAFSHGESCVYYDVDAPIQDLINRGLIAEKPFEKSLMDFHLYPVTNNGKLIFVVFICNAKKLYYGRPDLARAKVYMDTHWQGEYDKEKVAAAVNMSVAQLYRLFKEHTGMTPGDYHKRVKVERIKEKLLDKSLSVKEAFAACGEDSHSWLSTVFKQITGLSPTEYRNSLL